jgi:hypothetical protein
MQCDRIPGPEPCPESPVRVGATAATLATSAQVARPAPIPAFDISQAELEQYHAQKVQKDEWDEVLDGWRKSLLGRIQDGASVEPGPFQAEVRSYPEQRLSARALEEILGPAEVIALKSQVAPTIRTQLHVTLNPSR